METCQNCAHSAWIDRKSPMTEVCIACTHSASGAPSNWKALASTNGDRVRDMCDGDLAKFFAKKVMDQVALMAVESGRQIGGTQLAAMKEAYALTFFSWLRSPAEEVGK